MWTAELGSCLLLRRHQEKQMPPKTSGGFVVETRLQMLCRIALWLPPCVSKRRVVALFSAVLMLAQLCPESARSQDGQDENIGQKTPSKATADPNIAPM